MRLFFVHERCTKTGHFQKPSTIFFSYIDFIQLALLCTLKKIDYYNKSKLYIKRCRNVLTMARGYAITRMLKGKQDRKGCERQV